MKRAARDVFLTPTQAKANNRSLPRGFAWVVASSSSKPTLRPAKRTRKPSSKIVYESETSSPPRKKAHRSRNGRKTQSLASKQRRLKKGIATWERLQADRDAHREMQIEIIDTRIEALKTKLQLLVSRQQRMQNSSKSSKKAKGSARNRGGSVGLHAMVPEPPAPAQRSKYSGRVVKTPKKLTAMREPVKLSEPLRGCRRLLNKLLQHQGSHWFKHPVDYVALNLPDYPKKIKTPMDLGTVNTRLVTGVYRDIDAFAADVRLVWSNAMAYNVVNTDVHRAAMHLKKFFNTAFAKIPKFAKPRRKKKTSKSSSSKVNQNASIAALQEQVQNLQKMVEQKSKGGGARGSAAKRKNLSNTPLSGQEKRDLKENMYKLPHEKLQKIVEMLDFHGDEIVLDFDTMATSHLRELERYVKQQLAALRRKQRKKIQPSPQRFSPAPPPPLSPKRPSILESPLQPPSPTPCAPVIADTKPDSGSDSSSSSDSSDSDSSDGGVRKQTSFQSSFLSGSFHNHNPPRPTHYS